MKRILALPAALFFTIQVVVAGSNATPDTPSKRKADYFFLEGMKLKASGKFDDAYGMMTHAVHTDSMHAAALYELALYEAGLERWNSALELMRRSVAIASDHYPARLSLARLMERMEMLQEASAEYKELMLRYPKKTELSYFLADVLTRAGDIEGAIQAYNVLENLTGRNEVLSLQKYKLWQSIGMKEEALVEMENLQASFPLDPRYLILLGDVYMMEPDSMGKAFVCYTKAKELAPDDVDLLVSMAMYYGRTKEMDLALAAIHKALLSRDLEVDEKLRLLITYISGLKQTGSDTNSVSGMYQLLIDTWPDVSEYQMAYAGWLLELKKEEDAVALLEQVTRKDPSNRTAWQLLLSLALRKEDYPKIVHICNQGIAIGQDVAEFYFYLCVANYQMQEYDKALQACKEGIAHTDEENKAMQSDFYGQMGDIYQQMNHSTEAYKAYDHALELNPDNFAVMNNYSYYLALGNYELEKAERMSARTIKAEPDNATYLDTYAWIFYMQGRYTLAKIYIESAIEKDKSGNTELHDHYGHILFETGDKVGAEREWEKAKELKKKE